MVGIIQCGKALISPPQGSGRDFQAVGRCQSPWPLTLHLCGGAHGGPTHACKCMCSRSFIHVLTSLFIHTQARGLGSDLSHFLCLSPTLVASTLSMVKLTMVPSQVPSLLPCVLCRVGILCANPSLLSTYRKPGAYRFSSNANLTNE